LRFEFLVKANDIVLVPGFDGYRDDLCLHGIFSCTSAPAGTIEQMPPNRYTGSARYISVLLPGRGERTRKGWRIDTNRVRADEDRVAYAIPSPARRRTRGWVLPAVPTLAGKERDTRAAAS